VTTPFQELVAGLDYPMAILTTAPTGGEGKPSGCLVGFSSQSSLDPPLYTVWISRRNHTHGPAMAGDPLGVHFPDRSQLGLAHLFGVETGDEVDKFQRCRWHEGPHGVALLDHCATWFIGAVQDRRPTGDHTAVLLSPVAGEASPSWRPLGFQDVKGFQAGHPA
jgi:flavin reductase (DIM6/NTAB) family NADH-FMN oxidoreductase RutF